MPLFDNVFDLMDSSFNPFDSGSDYESMKNIICNLFHVRDPSGIRFQYADNDGDMISLSSRMELMEAIRQVVRNGSEILNLELLTGKKEISSPL